MNPKHLAIRIEQCLSLAKASNCPRRKFGAFLLDIKRNVILMDGYNGGPRGADGPLCGGHFCERDGYPLKDTRVVPVSNPPMEWLVEHIPTGRLRGWAPGGMDQEFSFGNSEAAEEFRQELAFKYPGVKSGTRVEIGCHHAEMNVICNAAAAGVATAGAWLIVTGEPCMMCSKLIHHAGIKGVYIVEGGYAGENGVSYLEKHGVVVQRVEGPEDPRLTGASPA